MRCSVGPLDIYEDAEGELYKFLSSSSTTFCMYATI